MCVCVCVCARVCVCVSVCVCVCVCVQMRFVFHVELVEEARADGVFDWLAKTFSTNGRLCSRASGAIAEADNKVPFT